MNPEISRFIWSRAANRCEYCHVPDIYEPGMHIDHVIAVQHRGEAVVAIQVLAINIPDFRAMRAALMAMGDYVWE